MSHEETWLHKTLESPWMALVWAAVGFFSLFMGYRDFRHHRQSCHNDNECDDHHE